MRRGASIAVLLVLLGGILAPLVQSAVPSIPACCRVSGNHHCMGAPGLDGFRSQSASCPYRTSPALLSEIVALISVTRQTSVFTFEPAALPARVAVALVKNYDAVPQRGPPLG